MARGDSNAEQAWLNRPSGGKEKLTYTNQTGEKNVTRTAPSTTSGDTLGEELVVFSHLRWDFVWQRPQHLVSRVGQHAGRVVFVEEPQAVADLEAPRLRWQPAGAVDRVWLEVPAPTASGHIGFDHTASSKVYPSLLAERLEPGVRRTVWLYTPLALPLAEAIGATCVAYDVMDDLASFKGASPRLRRMHERLLGLADVVFTGGRSLQRGVLPLRHDAECFPSGVELEHYAPARDLRRATVRPRPVAGYVGVIDERLDLDLIGGLAAQLPEWDVQMVGPVVKIDPASLPQASNLSYLGSRPYSELPDVMAGFDVALMPFALNEATRSISPTKSLEYLAAGLPVVSTRVPDVVSELKQVVVLADDPPEFAQACRNALADDHRERERMTTALLRWSQWDAIAERMHERLVAGLTVPARQEASS